MSKLKPKSQKKQSKRDAAALDHMILLQQGMVTVWDKCIADAADYATNYFLAGQDDIAKEFRNQLHRFQHNGREANGILCGMLLERAQYGDR